MLAVLGIAAIALLAYKDGPPPNRTGGFGGETCIACHLGNPLNAPGATLSLTGLPAKYTPGAAYKLTLTLTKSGLYTAGFQIAARTAASQFSGAFRPLDDHTQIKEGFLSHTSRGADAEKSPARWEFEWTAPAAASGDILFHAAANASNDDASALGDFIYTTEARLAAR
jgi:hypothetical protein